MRSWIVFWIALSLVPNVLQAQESTPEAPETPLEHLSAEDHFKSGTAALEAGQTKASIAHLRESVRLKPDFREAWYNLALAYSKTPEIKYEIAAYKQAIELDGDYAKAHYNLGICYEEAGQLKEAVTSYTRAVALDAEAFDARMNLGVVLAVLGKTEEAIKTYRKALQINSESADAHYNLGLALMKMGDGADEAAKITYFTEALSAYGEAVRFKPNFYKAEYNRALTYHRLGKTKEEIESFKKALVLRPSFPQALYNLAFTYEMEQEYTQALFYWKEYLKVAQKFETETPYIPAAEKAVKRLSKATDTPKGP